nr:MAG TPA: hypothetical protein [Caudoviricetes sp.]
MELNGIEPLFTCYTNRCAATSSQPKNNFISSVSTHLTLRLDFLREICVAIFTSTPQMICIYNSYFQYEIISLSNSFY